VLKTAPPDFNIAVAALLVAIGPKTVEQQPGDAEDIVFLPHLNSNRVNLSVNLSNVYCR
jgi:hypothetical protein